MRSIWLPTRSLPIAVAATGYNNVDIAAARQNDTTVCNIPVYGSDSVAEHSMMLMLALMRNLPAYQRDVAAGLWAQSPFFCHFGAPMRDLKGKTLVIFGRGSIGRTLANYAEVFGMKVLFGEHKTRRNQARRLYRFCRSLAAGRCGVAQLCAE